MLPVYLGALAFGGVLIVASIVLGGADADADIDADMDVDVDVDADVDVDVDADVDADGHIGHGDGLHDAEAGGGGWYLFLSMRFWTFGLASFGLAGVLFTLLGFVEPFAGGLSGALAFGAGTAAAWFFRQLKRGDVSGSTGIRHLRGTEGIALLPVAPGGLGKIRLLIDGQHVDLPARTKDNGTIDRKQAVLVVGVDEGVAEVTRIPLAATTKGER